MLGRLRTFFLLASRLVVHLLTLPFARSDPLQLEETYREDRLPILTYEDTELARVVGLCDGCGLCDIGCALTHGPDMPGPSRLILSLTRSAPDTAAVDLEPYRACLDCRACSGWCPRGIPIEQVPGWFESLVLRAEQPTYHLPGS